MAMAGDHADADAVLDALLRARGADRPMGKAPRVKSPEPLVISWRGRQLRIRHDDPRLTVYSPRGARLRAAIELASDVEGLRLVLNSTITDRYRVRVADDGSVVGL